VSEDVVRRVAGSTVSLAGRRVGLTALSGLSTAVIARCLGPASYGAMASAVATFTLLLALSDFGFSLTLGRDLALDPARRRSTLLAAIHVQSIWAALLALGLLAIAVVTGLDTVHGMSLAVLVPAVAVSGLVGARSVFAVTYEMPRLVRIDLIVTVGQVGLMILLAQAGAGPVAVAAAVGAGYVVNTVWAALAGLRLAGRSDDDETPTSRRALARRVAPLGLMGFMSQVYLTIDLVLLGWMVHGRALGDYAAASKMLTILTQVAGLVMAAALPAFATSAAASGAELSRVSARVWHWLAAVALPCLVGAALFAPIVVAIVLGPGYGGAVGLLRILTLAGIVGVASNCFGTILVAKHRVRPLLIQNGFAITFNITGNLLLVPRFGVQAAAWLTVATEVIVCSGSLYTLRGELPAAPLLAVSWRPALAVAGAGAVAIGLAQWPVLALAGSATAFLFATLALHAWPQELRWTS
jgi:O-antigen/teichoic acid export membrane protein